MQTWKNISYMFEGLMELFQITFSENAPHPVHSPFLDINLLKYAISIHTSFMMT